MNESLSKWQKNKICSWQKKYVPRESRLCSANLGRLGQCTSESHDLHRLKMHVGQKKTADSPHSLSQRRRFETEHASKMTNSNFE
jgi:hypothetical protein